MSEDARDALRTLSLAPQSKNDRIPQWLLPYRQPLCAYAASMWAIGVGFPLDSIKTRQQTHKYRSVWNCVVDTHRSEGIRGFYRGIVAPLVSSSVVRALSVSVYNYALPYTSKLAFSVYAPPKDHGHSPDALVRRIPVAFLAGVCAGTSCTMLGCPFEFTKLASQIDGLVRQQPPQSTFQVAKKLVKIQGIKVLYSGWKYHMLRDALGSGIYFTVYETIKSAFGDMLGPGAIAAGGALAGSCSWILIYPLDTYKSMIQRDLYARAVGANIVQARKRSLLQMYSRRMYRGLSVSLVRTSVMGMMFFTSYEWLIKHV